MKQEVEAAVAARDTGNEGKARVCARRAAGAAIGYWLQRQRLPDAGPDAMSRLRAVEQAPMIPLQVREAARRLVTKITERFTAPFSDDPLADARVIANYCCGDRRDEGM